MPYTRPIKLQLLLDELIENMPTQITEAIRPVITQPLPTIELAVEPEPQTPPRDSQGRPFIQVNNPYEHTYDLVDALVDRFLAYTGVYPAVILLSALRYLTVGQKMQHLP